MTANLDHFDRSVIEAEYRRLRYGIGWRFMMGPARTLDAASTAFVMLNPGGDRPHGPDWSSEAGSAFTTERWGGLPAGTDKLQRQMQTLCALLGVRPDDVLAGQFVPFRSRDWTRLENREAACAFGRRLWRWALAQAPRQTVVCIGKQVVGAEIAAILGARNARSIPAGWGSQTIERLDFGAGGKLVMLPHLGRFALVGRQASAEALRAAFA